MKILSIIALSLLLIIFLGLGYLIYLDLGNPNNEEILAPKLESIVIQKPNLIVNGENLDKVEIYALLSDKGPSGDGEILLGEAKREVYSGSERWLFEIPKEPILVNQIYAVGYQKNTKTDKVNLPIVGSGNIYNALWAESNSALITLRVGQTGTFNNLSIKLLGITEDSRCPKDVVCIQAGDVLVNTRLISESSEETVDIYATGDVHSFGGYFVDIIETKPDPIAGDVIDQSLYQITFSVSKGNNL